MTEPNALASALADRYRIERELGQGGMATVYLAEDLKHRRKVAIKVLRPELAAVIGAERFLREIQTIANLQHPHVLGLIDSGEARVVGHGSWVEGGDNPPTHDSRPTTFLYYVMPFVEGESLRERLQREKQLPIADAVRIASEVAGALDYAHRHGVIHRDIKPENILLHDGSALVADFGIALAMSKSGGTRMTETGMSLGTPHYMSPEQAMGEREITARSDVYALGVVTYEMLVGEPPFTGPTAQAIIAKVMTSDPVSLTSQRRSVPPAVEDAVLTALQKLPADRFATAAEFSAALGSQAVTRTGRQPTGPTARQPQRPTALYVALAAAIAALIAVSVFALGRPRLTGPTAYDAVLPDSAPVRFGLSASNVSHGEAFRNLTVAPAGDLVVYAAARGDSTMLWIRSLINQEARPLSGATGATAPRFSPDGTQIAYLHGDDVMLVPLAGGAPRVLQTGSGTTDAVNWLSPTQLIIGTEDGFRVNWFDIGGGAPRTRRIARCANARSLPGSSRLICNYNRSATVLDPENDTRWPMLMAKPDGTPGDPVAGTGFTPIDGKYIIYFANDGVLVGARFDPEKYLVSHPVRLLSGIRRETLGGGQMDIAGNGTLVYAPGLDGTQAKIVKLRSGAVPEPLPVGSGDFQRLDLSRDGRWLAAAVTGMQHTELRIYDLVNHQESVWAEGDMVRHPVWSPDGRTLMYGIINAGRWQVRRGQPGLSGELVTLIDTTSSGLPGTDPVDWREDHLAVAQDWVNFTALRFDPMAAKPVFDTLATGVTFGSISPNGKLLSYQSPQVNRIFVMGLAPGMRRWQVASVGAEPIWLSPTELLFRDGFTWYKVMVNPETGEPKGPPAFWARDPRFSDTSGWSNRPTTDGAIIYAQGPEEHGSTYLRVIPNWVAQMKAAVDKAGS